MKLGLILAGPLQAPLPSTRVALLNILPQLQQAGVAYEVLHAPHVRSEMPVLELRADAIAATGVNTVVFQKVHGPSALALARALEGVGVRTVFMVCDRVVPEMAQATSATVCVTQHLASLYPREMTQKIHVVHDGIEQPAIRKTCWRADRGSTLNPLRAVLVTSGRLDEIPMLGMPPPWLHLDIVGQYPAREDWLGCLREHWRAWRREPARRGAQMRLALHLRVTLHRWRPDVVYEHLTRADIGVLPIDRSPPITPSAPAPAWSVKSENRLTLKMSLGLPVVATPIPAYRPIVEQGRNAYFAETRSDWLAALESLRDPAHRRAVGEAAHHAVAQAYSMQRQAELLLGVLRQLSVTSCRGD